VNDVDFSKFVRVTRPTAATSKTALAKVFDTIKDDVGSYIQTSITNYRIASMVLSNHGTYLNVYLVSQRVADMLPRTDILRTFFYSQA
jgi:hypothetical protein